VERPDWQALAQAWPNGHIKLAWTRHLLKLRHERPDVFADGDYEPLEVSGPHRDHVVAFARRRGRHAVITAAARWFAPLSQQGRHWPHGEAFEGELHIDGYSLEGTSNANKARIPLAVLFAQLPIAALRAVPAGTIRLVAKRATQFA
jgi:(1->4)-alpha-D-glucan 1-alpha-D-glucosylmutase